MNIFKSKEQKELEMLTTKLVKTILKSEQLLALITNAKKQWEFDELRAQKLSYPVIQDLVNTASVGIVIDVRMADGGSFTIKTDPNLINSDLLEQEKMRKQ